MIRIYWVHEGSNPVRKETAKKQINRGHILEPILIHHQVLSQLGPLPKNSQ